MEPAASPPAGWAGAWGAFPTIPPTGAKTFENQTVRQVVRLSSGGAAVRIRFTNEYGDKPLEIDAVMRDPANPKKMKADLQSGDWLHPNDAGYKVMGDAIDLALFK